VRNKVRLYLLISICATISVLLAQTDRGAITGSIKYPSGAVVPGMQVTATQVATNTGYKTTTSSGDFTVPSLPVVSIGQGNVNK
jgi:hypothetical protein